jgi:nucleoside-diphosphate-sugar epimerase
MNASATKRPLRVGLTGPKGFVGSAVVAAAPIHGVSILSLGKSEFGTLGEGRLESTLLSGCSSIIHVAARAHRREQDGPIALAAYRRTNVDGTRELIDVMERMGVRRLVYVSSIKALAERSGDSPLRPNDARSPEDSYGRSKAEAEMLVEAAHSAGRIEAVILRPVLVHGPGAKGNLDRLMKAVSQKRWLPFGSIENRRSMIGVENLANSLIVAAKTPMYLGAKATIFNLADQGVISSRGLVETLSEGMGFRPKLIPLPKRALVVGAALLGKADLARRLFDNLEVDSTGFAAATGWKQSKTLREGLLEMAAQYRRSVGNE